MKHCLIVDDCKLVRRVARCMFENLHFCVSEVGDAEEALDFCRQYRPDVILLDWHMPGMSGIEFLYKFNELKLYGEKCTTNHGPYIFICTTQGSAADVREAVTAGADDYIHKPFDQNILESKLHLVGLC